MHDIQANLYECLHCKGEGTCRNAEKGNSCAACVKLNDLKGTHHGLICRACGGIGKADTLTERIGNRTPSLLAIFTIAGLFIILITAAATNNPHTNQLIAFSGGIIGTILGFYFSNRSLK